MPKRARTNRLQPLPDTSQGLIRLGNDCLTVILSFLLKSVDLSDFSKLRRWMNIQSVCKQLYQACHLPQLIGLLNVKACTSDVVQKLSQMAGVQRLCCYITSSNEWCELLPKFQSLQELYLSLNLTDVVFKNVSLCTTIKSLYLMSGTKWSTEFHACSTLTSLEKLRMTHGFTNENLKVVALLTNLHDLDISCSPNVSDEGLKLLSKLRLRRLNVSYTSISDVGLLSLNLEGMENLEMKGTRITTDAFFSHLRSLSSLKINRLGAVAALTSLTELALLNYTATKIHQDVSKLTNLRTLQLAGAKLDLRALRLPRLQSLVLFGCGLRYLDSLARLCHLESLSLRFRGLSDTHVAELSVLITGLKELNLSGAKITDAAFRNISCVKSLRILNINYCSNLTDESLNWIGQLQQLEVLRFDDTGISKTTAMERLPHVDWD